MCWGMRDKKGCSVGMGGRAGEVTVGEKTVKEEEDGLALKEDIKGGGVDWTDAVPETEHD